MIDRCNIGIRQAWDDYNILSLFLFQLCCTRRAISFPSCWLWIALFSVLLGFTPRGQKPPRRNNVDVTLTDRGLNLIKQWEIRFQRKEATCGDKKTLEHEAKGTAMHTRQDALEMPSSHRRVSTPRYSITEKSERTLQLLASGDADCAPRRPPVTAFLPAWRQQTGSSAKPPHHQRSPHSLVWGDKRLHVDYRISGILHPGSHYSGNRNLRLICGPNELRGTFECKSVTSEVGLSWTYGVKTRLGSVGFVSLILVWTGVNGGCGM